MKTKKIRNFILSLSIVVIAGLMPSEANAAGPGTLTVNGEDILAAPGRVVSCGNGRAEYDETENILTLDNASITDAVPGNTSGGISYGNGDLTIVLIGENSIDVPASYGILGSSGTLTIQGDGTLTINCVYAGIRNGAGGNITVDGAKLYVNAKSLAPFEGMGIHAEGILEIFNGAYVELNGDVSSTGESGLTAGKGISISDSTVKANMFSSDSYNAIVSNADISITNSQVDASTSSVYGDAAIWVEGKISVTGDSELNVRSETGHGIWVNSSEILISESGFTATAYYPALQAPNITLTDSTVTAESTADWGIWAADSLLIQGDSTVTAKGNIVALGAGNSFTLEPSEGGLTDVSVGADEASASAIEGSPLSEAKIFDPFDGSIKYFYSAPHVHIYDQMVASDAYKVSDATCTDPASYQYSCICLLSSYLTSEYSIKSSQNICDDIPFRRIKSATILFFDTKHLRRILFCVNPFSISSLSYFFFSICV